MNINKLYKIIIFILILSAMAGISFGYNYKNKLVTRAIKYFIKKAETNNKDTNLLRAFQYTCTTQEKNYLSLVLRSEKARIDAGLKKKEKGKFLHAFNDRNTKRIKKLWKDNKELFFKLVSKELFYKIINNHKSYWILNFRQLIKYREHKQYSAIMKKAVNEPKKINPLFDEWYFNIEGSDFDSMVGFFWYRRALEKNDKVVYEILKEIMNKYYDKKFEKISNKK